MALTIHLCGIKGLLATTPGGDCDPYVEFWLSRDPSNRQMSTVKTRTLAPVWAPPEAFTFMPFKKREMSRQGLKLMCSVFDRDHIGSDDAMGDCQFKLGGLEVGAEDQPVRLNLINGSTGEETGAYVDVRLTVDCAFKAYGTEEELIYQYERWDFIHKWSSEHLLPTDPGRWSDHKREIYMESFEEIERKLEDGWSVRKNWEVSGRPGSNDGWEYAFGFRFPGWFDKPFCFMRVRRRVWRRIIVNNNILHPERTSSMTED